MENGFLKTIRIDAIKVFFLQNNNDSMFKEDLSR